MEKSTSTMSPEKFAEIYTNEKLRNQVAYAHECWSSSPGSHFLHRKTCSYPVEWIVTDDQIEAAKKELKRAKEELKKNHYNDLIFVCMGGDYPARFEDDVCNHRIRTEFLNPVGRRFFIEFSMFRNHETYHIDFSIDRDLEETRKAAHDPRQDYYNYGSLQKVQPFGKYTRQNVLELVNKIFDCKFKNIIIDEHTADFSDSSLICESPK